MIKALRSAHPLMQVTALAAFGFFMLFVMFVVVTAVFYAMGTNVLVVAGNANLSLYDASVVRYMKWLQIAQAIGLFTAPFLVYYIYLKSEDETFFTLRGNNFLQTGIFALSMLLAFPFINWMAEWNAQLTLPEAMSGIETWIRSTESRTEELIKLFLTMDTLGELAFNLLLIAIIPAICEELFFRGTILPLVSRTVSNEHAAVWITAFIFSFFHFQFLGFVPRLVLGAILGYGYIYSGSLWVPIAGHLMNNGLAVVLTYFIGVEMLDESIEVYGSQEGQWITVAMSAMALACGLLLVHRWRPIKKPSQLETA